MAARAGRAVVVAALVLLILVPVGSLATPAAPSARVVSPSITSAAGFSAYVTWNGVNVSSYNSASSSLSIDFSKSANLKYTWSGPASETSSINDARLQMLYFGLSLVTRDVFPAGSGGFSGTSVVLNWTPGALEYVFEGLYEITASLLYINGSTAWSENFYVHESAPYFILAALPLILLLLGIYELYAVARSGRLATFTKAKKAPPAPPPSGGAPVGEPVERTPDGEVAPPAEEAPK